MMFIAISAIDPSSKGRRSGRGRSRLPKKGCDVHYDISKRLKLEGRGKAALMVMMMFLPFEGGAVKWREFNLSFPSTRS